MMIEVSQLVPNPFNWSPKTVFYRNLSIGRSNQKNSKNLVHLFSNFDSGRTSQLVPNPFNWSPKTVFYRNLSIGRSNKKNQKTKSIYFQILLLGGPSPPSQLVPNPFNWSPNTVFYRYLRIGRSNQKIEKTISIYLHFCTFQVLSFKS